MNENNATTGVQKTSLDFSVDRPPSQTWTLILTSVAFFMCALDLLVVITALPSIHTDLGGTLSALQWTVNAYSLAAAAGIISAAALGDRLGRRRVFTLGLGLFTAASAACALAPSTEWLIAARILQGMGAAIVAPLSLTILVAAFPASRRGAIVGIWGGIAGLAIAGGPLIGGAITQGLSWHWIFWVNVPIGAVTAVLSISRLTESRGAATRLDLPGVALVSGGVVGIVWGLVRVTELGWANLQVEAGLGAGVLLTLGFLAWEHRVLEPMLPPRLFSSRTFVAANATTFLMSAALLGSAFLISQYLQIGLGNSPLGAGLRFLPMTAAPLVVAPLAGIVSDRLGRRPVMVVGMLLMAVGLGWFAQVAKTGVGYQELILPMLAAGVGVSMTFATAPTAALGAVAPTDMGKASGANATFQRFGGAFGIALATAVFASNGHLGGGPGFNAGLRPALAAAAGLALAGALSALFVGGRPLQAVSLDEAPSIVRAA